MSISHKTQCCHVYHCRLKYTWNRTEHNFTVLSRPPRLTGLYRTDPTFAPCSSKFTHVLWTKRAWYGYWDRTHSSGWYICIFECLYICISIYLYIFIYLHCRNTSLIIQAYNRTYQESKSRNKPFQVARSIIGKASSSTIQLEEHVNYMCSWENLNLKKWIWKSLKQTKWVYE